VETTRLATGLFRRHGGVLVKDLKQFPQLAGLQATVRGAPESVEGRAAFPDCAVGENYRAVNIKSRSHAAFDGFNAVVLAQTTTCGFHPFAIFLLTAA